MTNIKIAIILFHSLCKLGIGIIIQMAYHTVAKQKDLSKGEMKHAMIGRDEILIANIDGIIYAINDRCGHMNASLSKGKLDGKIVQCPLHKALYDVTTGKCVAGPHMGGLEGVFMATTGSGKVTGGIDTLDQKTYRTKLDGDSIQVEITEC